MPHAQSNDKRTLIEVKDEHVYQWLTSYYLHQDQLSWSRTQTIVAVEAGVIAAAFSLDGRSSAIPLLLGSLIVWLLWNLIRRDWAVREQDLTRLDPVHERYGIRLVQAASGPWRSGTKVATLLTWLLLGTNGILAAMFAACGSKRFMDW